MPPQQRNISFDVLKAIGLLCVILAHTPDLPAPLFAARNFDVPLMVFVSGLLFKSGKSDYWAYLRKRIPRLLAPVWIFMFFFFTTSPLFDKSFTIEEIMGAVLMLDGMDYIWIIRVFVLIAAVSPLLAKLQKQIGDRYFIVTIAVIYLTYEVCLHWLNLADFSHYFDHFGFPHTLPDLIQFLLSDLLLLLIPYACVFSLGTIAKSMKTKYILLLGTACLMIFGVIAFSLFGLLETQQHKYPPDLFYLSYALGVSLLLYGGSKWKGWQRVRAERIMPAIVFLSASSMWVYLWHILVLQFLPQGLGVAASYGFVVGGAVALTMGQKTIVNWAMKRLPLGNAGEELVSVMFLK